jgi:tetratricopeptide (TPR) repeat protein
MRNRLCAMALVLLVICAGDAPAQTKISPEIEALKQKVEKLEQAGKLAEATELAKRALALAEQQFGPDSQETGWIVHSLAMLYLKQGRNDESQHLLKRSMEIDQKTLQRWQQFKTHSQAQRYADKLANEVEGAKRSLARAEQKFPAGHPDIGRALGKLASLYRAQGRLGEAEPLYRRSLSVLEAALGPEHPEIGGVLNDLASIYDTQGRYAEAEPLYRRVLDIAQKAIRNKALPQSYPDLARTMNKLANLYYAQQRYSDAEPLFKTLLAFREQTLGPDDHNVGAALNNLAAVYEAQGRYKEAEPLYRRALEIAQKNLPEGHPDIATSLDNLAALLRAQDRYAEAESLFKSSLSVREKALPKDDPEIANSLDNLARLYDAQRRYSDAEPLCRRAFDIAERALFSKTSPIALCSVELGHAYFVNRDWARAVEFWRHSTRMMARRLEHGSDDFKRTATGEGQRLLLLSLVKAAYRLTQEGGAAYAQAGSQEAPQEMFETAQLAESSEAGRALAQMATRVAKGNPELAKVLRERQDLVGEARGIERLLIAAERAKPFERNIPEEKDLSDRLMASKGRVAEIDKSLAKAFLDYTVLAMNLQIPVADVQALLGPDEALVLFLGTPEVEPVPQETFLWVITKTNLRWLRSEFGSGALGERVAALRCGLDATAW